MFSLVNMGFELVKVLASFWILSVQFQLDCVVCESIQGNRNIFISEVIMAVFCLGKPQKNVLFLTAVPLRRGGGTCH